MLTSSESIQHKRRRRGAVACLLLSTLLGTAAFGQESELAGLIRSGKTPDRDVYQPPTLPSHSSHQTGRSLQSQPSQSRPMQSQPAQPISGYEDDNERQHGQVAQVAYDQPVILQAGGPAPRRVTHAAPGNLPAAQRQASPAVQQVQHYAADYHAGGSGGRGYRDSAVRSYAVETSCGSELGYCDSGCCDTGCDSGFYGGGCDAGCGCGSARPVFGDCRDSKMWFASAELMLLFRSGDRLPVLATNGTAALFGGDKYYDDMTPGARVMVGTWLDNQRCTSLVFRGWGTGQESFSFNADSSMYATIERPFLDVSPGTPAGGTSESLVVAQPGTNGSISIRGTSEVYGADIALHRTWRAGLGGVIELVYGYQHMRLTEDLGISTTSFANTLMQSQELFEADNNFNGGEIGIATRYREGCWSFNGMFKLAGGSLQRTATLSGNLTGIPDDPLLVRASNRGTFRDSTFGWVPELNLSLGYRYTQNLDFTVGYHMIAMSDALQVSGVLDPQMAVNTDYPTSSPARPAAGMRYGTFTAQSITMGLQYVY